MSRRSHRLVWIHESLFLYELDSIVYYVSIALTVPLRKIKDDEAKLGTGNIEEKDQAA